MSVEQVVPGVWRAGTRFVNWYVVDGGAAGLTLVDCGLPGYRKSHHRTLARLGRDPGDVKALVLTHGHIDHVGAATHVAQGGAVVHLHPADRELAADPGKRRPDDPSVRYVLWPATFAFLMHAVAHGAAKKHHMPTTAPLADGEEVNVPGHPRVLHTPGHTAGHCALEFREHGVAFVGDALCTSDPFSGRPTDPQVQTRGSNADSEQAMRSLDRLTDIASRVLLPGHGDPWRDGAEAAVASARKVGCR